MTSSTDIIAKSEAAFEAFGTTDDRPTDVYVIQIYDAITKIFYPIRYSSIGATHNLMGLIDEDAAYATEYGELFPWPLRPGIYVSDSDTTKDASLDSRKKEAIYMAESKADRFIVRVVVDFWISPLSKGVPTFYAKRKTKELLDQLQFLCTGHHTIDLLALQDEIRTMHVSTNTIPQ